MAPQFSLWLAEPRVSCPPSGANRPVGRNLPYLFRHRKSCYPSNRAYGSTIGNVRKWGTSSQLDLGRTFAANAGVLQLHALAYNLGTFMRTLAMPETAEPWSLTTLREQLVKIGAKFVSHGR